MGPVQSGSKYFCDSGLSRVAKWANIKRVCTYPLALCNSEGIKTKMENETVKIVHLRGAENWASWKFQIHVILNSSSAWNIVSWGDAQSVEDAGAFDAALAIYRENFATWENADRIGQRVIGTSVGPRRCCILSTVKLRLRCEINWNLSTSSNPKPAYTYFNDNGTVKPWVRRKVSRRISRSSRI